MKKILGVVRASTEHQEIISQKAELSQYIIGLGYNEADIEWLEVAGASARKADKDYLDMLQSIKDTITLSGTIKAAAFWHLNRLGRRDTYLINMKDWFITNRIQVYIKNPSLKLLNDDLSVNAGGEIAWNVYAAMVKLETEEMFEKLKRGKKRNAENGVFNGGTIQFGYQLNTTTHKLEYNNEEIDVLKLVFTEYVESKLSTFKLAKELQDRGITQRGKKITAQWLQRVLVSTSFKELVGDVLFEQAQEIVRSRNVNRKTKHIHIAGGLVYCPVCGGRMFAETKGYKCYNHYNQFRNDTSIECDFTPKLSTVVIDNLAFDVAMVGYTKFASKSHQTAIKDHNREITINRQKIHQNGLKVAKMEDKQQRIKMLFVNGDIDVDEYQKMKQEVLSEAKSIEENTKYLEDRNRELEAKIGLLEGGSDIERLVKSFDDVDNADIGEAYQITHKFIKRITFDKMDKSSYVIEITTIDEGVWRFAYYPYRKDGKVIQMIVGEEMVDYILKKRFEYGEVVKVKEFISW